jgi:Tol biopolymer transport system component
MALPLLLPAPAPAETGSRIAYAQGGRLNFVTPTGAPLESTRKLSSFKVDIGASDDGRRVAVLARTGTAGAHGDFYRVYVWTAGRGKLQQVPVGGPIETRAAPSLALSPGGRTLALSIGSRIRLVDLVSGRRRTLRKQARGFDVQPSFSADGRRLVFCHGRGFERPGIDIYEIVLGDGSVRRLTRSGPDEFFPQLSPDGRHLAFLRRRQDGFDLIFARVDGMAETLVRRVGDLSARPDFSPNGRRLAYASVKGLEHLPFPYWKLQTIGLDGRAARTIERTRSGPLLPQWTMAP